MVIPSGFIVWYVVLFVGFFCFLIAEDFCPKDQMTSGGCIAGWWVVVEKIIFTLFAGLSAVSVVAIPTFVAPCYKVKIATAAYLVGATFAIVFAVTMGENRMFELISALLFGGLTLIVILEKLEDSPSPVL